MPTYKLIYHNEKGRAEVPRWMFKKAAVEFEDVRLGDEEWKAMKESTPFRQLPILEVDGVVIFQSLAIYRLLGSRLGFYGKNDIEEALIDSVVGSVEDTIKPLEGIYMEKDEAKKEEKRKKYEEEQLPIFLGYFEQILKSNNGGGYFVGNSMSVADMHFAHSIIYPQIVKVDTKLQNFPKLQALKNRVESDPKIAEWIKIRPETPF